MTRSSKYYLKVQRNAVWEFLVPSKSSINGMLRISGLTLGKAGPAPHLGIIVLVGAQVNWPGEYGRFCPALHLPYSGMRGRKIAPHTHLRRVGEELAPRS